MNRTDRLLAIVLELQANGPRRAEELARTFETSRRTIYRDMQALGEAGVPMVSAEGGWTLDEGYFLPPMAFTVDEATLLLLGADAVAPSFDAEYRMAADAARRKIESALPEAIRARVDALRSSLIMIQELRPSPPEELETMRMLRRAILRQQTVRFRYFTRYPGDGRVSMREADPYGLAWLENAWFVMAYCHQRKDMRTFKLARMGDVALVGRTFERPTEYDVNDPRFRTDTRSIVIQLQFDEDAAPWVMEDRNFFIETREPNIDGVAVTLRVSHLDQAVPWVLGWGRRVRVIEPAELHERIRHEARAILENSPDSL